MEKKLVVPAQKVAEVVEKLEVTNPMSLLKEERLRRFKDETPVPPFATERSVPRVKDPMVAVAAESLLEEAVVA